MTRRKEGGQVLILAVAGLGILLMGFAGLGIDIGYFRYEKRLQQTAADGAAIAGAAELLYDPTGAGSDPAAKHDAAANGFADSTGGAGCPTAVGCITVTTHTPPSTGPHTGGMCPPNCYSEVLVAQVQPTFFMRALGITSETVTARAVAKLTGNTTGCIYTLGTASKDGITVHGGGKVPVNINAPNCGIIDDSQLTVTGGGTIVSGSIGAVTGACGSSNCTPAAITGIVPQPDPLAYLTPPPIPGSCQADPSVKKNTTTTIFPGNYCKGITINSGANVTFSSGVYVLGDDLSVNGASNLTGSNVMFYDTKGTFNMGGADTLNLSAPNVSDPTTGAVAGVLFWQAASNSNDVTLHGNVSTFVQGAIYAPSAQVTLDGNSSSTLYTILVVRSLTLNGDDTLNIKADTSGVTGGSPIKNAILVE